MHGRCSDQSNTHDEWEWEERIGFDNLNNLKHARRHGSKLYFIDWDHVRKVGEWVYVYIFILIDATDAVVVRHTR